MKISKKFVGLLLGVSCLAVVADTNIAHASFTPEQVPSMLLAADNKDVPSLEESLNSLKLQFSNSAVDKKSLNHVKEHTRALKQLISISQGYIANSALNVNPETETLEESFLLDSQNLEGLQTLIEAGANPYILFLHEKAINTIYENPDIMAYLIDSGVDFTLCGGLHNTFKLDTPKRQLQRFMRVDYRDGPSSKFQKENFAKSFGILVKAFPELKPDVNAAYSELSRSINNQMRNFVHYSNQCYLMAQLEEHGIISQEEAELILSHSNLHIPSGKTINPLDYRSEFYERYRLGYKDHTVHERDTIESIADRYQPYSTAPDTKSFTQEIIEYNQLDNDILPGQTIRMPIDPSANLITYKVPNNTTILDAIKKFQSQLFGGTGDLDKDIKAVLKLNGVGDIPDTLSDKLIRAPSTNDSQISIKIPLKNDFANTEQLNLPVEKDVTLVVIEGDTPHLIKTFKTASGLDFFRSGDDSDVIAVTERNMGKMDEDVLKLYLSANARNSEIIFSKSYGTNPNNDIRKNNTPAQMEDDYDCAPKLYDPAYIQYIDFYERNKTIHFYGAGNNHDTHPDLNISDPGSLSRGGVTVGAIHEQNGIKYIGGYSSVGVDICTGRLHNIDGEEVDGTSFSTPDMIDLYQDMAQAYGNDLTHEEIMTAAFYSTDLDIKDFEPHNTIKLNTQYNEASNNVSGELKEGAVDQLAWANFDINAAGIPHHPRIGAGVINPKEWIKNLEKMKTLKQLSHCDDEILTERVPLHDIEPEIIQENGKALYAYKIPIHLDMTLGKISMILPQEAFYRSKAAIVAPSGTKIDMPYLNQSIYSTFALSCEDANEGDYLTITTEKKFTDEAEIIVRGYERGSAIEAFRDYMLQNNLTQKPHTVYQTTDQTLQNLQTPALAVTHDLNTQP